MLLNCHTYYSYRYGTLSLQRVFEEIRSKGYSSFALTDINSTSACLDLIRHAPEHGIRPVAGIDFRNGAEQKYIGLARNNEGFRELNEHLNAHMHAAEPFGETAPPFTNCYVIYPMGGKRVLRENEFMGIRPAQVRNLAFSHWKDHLHKLVVLQPVTFSCKRDFNAHRLLRAIDKNILLSKLPKSEEAREDEIAVSEAGLAGIFEQYPLILENTKRLLDDCGISFEFGTNKNKKSFSGSIASDVEMIRRECEKGLAYRYGKAPGNVLERMEKELKLITQLGFCSYFLINWHMVNYARTLDFYYVGLGSGANSLVAFLLRITDVDPIELDLYFERFINPYRSNPPDFDIDFSWTDRDEMTEYIFDRFGRKRTALLGTYSTFQHDAVTRELGKVFGLPPAEIDRLQRPEHEKDADEIGRLVLRYGNFLKGFPSHLSIHSSGIIISEEEITNYSATNLPPKGYPTTQFSMIEAEDIGLYKFDILSQRGLGKIKDALTIIKKNKKVDIDIHDIKKFTSDPTVKKLLSEGKCIGCFYIESPAMRMLLAKLRADDYLRLVAASSIIRPGVAKSGMMREYILRFRDESKREAARAELPELYD